MHPNHELINRFYSAFQKLDYTVMQSCYADETTFSDAVFLNLDSSETKAMWEMLCKRANNLVIDYTIISADDKTGTASWTATYIFTATGRKVTNHIKASFEFSNGKISKHSDKFSLYKWSQQAFGSTGLLMGWMPFFRNKVRTGAKSALHSFMGK